MRTGLQLAVTYATLWAGWRFGRWLAHGPQHPPSTFVGWGR